MTYGSFFQVSFNVGRGRARLGEIVVFLENGGKVEKSVLTQHTFRWHNSPERKSFNFGGNEAELVIGRLSSAEAIAWQQRYCFWR